MKHASRLVVSRHLIAPHSFAFPFPSALWDFRAGCDPEPIPVGRTLRNWQAFDRCTGKGAFQFASVAQRCRDVDPLRGVREMRVLKCGSDVRPNQQALPAEVEKAPIKDRPDHRVPELEVSAEAPKYEIDRCGSSPQSPYGEQPHIRGTGQSVTARAPATGSCPDGTYTNSAGQEVCRPYASQEVPQPGRRLSAATGSTASRRVAKVPAQAMAA